MKEYEQISVAKVTKYVKGDARQRNKKVFFYVDLGITRSLTFNTVALKQKKFTHIS